MKLVLGKHISCEFWRRVYPTNRAPGQTARLPLELEFAYKRSNVLSLAPAWATPELIEAAGGTIDAYVQTASLRRKSKSHQACYLGNVIPEGSFFDLGNNVFVAAPWFVFLQFACELSLPELIAYAYELCGFYSLDASQERGFKMRSAALTNRDQLEQYLKNANGVFGQSKALKALELTEERAASPMETEAHMLLNLPYRYGGYGINGFALNREIRLDEQAACVARKTVCFADMCNFEKKLIVEFQGKRDHAGIEAFDADRARINGLKEMGFEVVELTSGQIGDLYAFETIALRLARILGKRIYKRDLGPASQRIELRHTLFDWSGASCHRAC